MSLILHSQWYLNFSLSLSVSFIFIVELFIHRILAPQKEMFKEIYILIKIICNKIKLKCNEIRGKQKNKQKNCKRHVGHLFS